MSKCDFCKEQWNCKECNGIKEVDLGVSKIIEQIREEHDKFVLETILPYCNEITKMELSKDDIMEAFRIWTAFRDGRLEWKNPAVVRSRCAEWHPYPKEKPTEEKSYLVTFEGSATGNKYIKIAGYLRDDFAIGGVTAWAELPKPYEEGAEE